MSKFAYCAKGRKLQNKRYEPETVKIDAREQGQNGLALFMLRRINGELERLDKKNGVIFDSFHKNIKDQLKNYK